MRYLDPKNDLTFKRVFGEHPHLLRSLLNALLPLKEEETIETLEYIPMELSPDLPLLKNTIVDVRCVDKQGRQFIVEMQVLWTDSFMNRVLFNASKAYVRQLNKGQEYKYLQPVYSLNLIDDTFNSNPDVFYHHYKIVNIENTNEQIKGLELVFVELPKFKPKDLEQKKLQVLWLRYLTEIKDGTTDISDDLLTNPDVKEAIECLQESAFTKNELEAYDKYWDQIRIERTIREDSHLKGREEGREEGKQIGLHIGKQIGMQEGEQIGLAKGVYKTALRILRKGSSIAETIELTGLDNPIVQKLDLLLKKYASEAENHLNEIN